MKFVFYKDGSKYTVNNASVHDLGELRELLLEETREKFMSDFELHNLQITSTRGTIQDEAELDNQEIIKEVREGIGWFNETVN